MALSDPQSVTIGASTISLPRVSSAVNAGGFASNDGAVRELVSHQYGKRTRHFFRLDHKKIVTDPLVPAQNAERSMSVYIVPDVPTTGYTVAEQVDIVKGFMAQLAASDYALLVKLLGGEN